MTDDKRNAMDTNNQPYTKATVLKKKSGFKRNLILLLLLSVFGGLSYLAYQQGALNQYLPRSLKVFSENPSVPLNAEIAAPSNSPYATVNDLAAPLSQLQSTSVAIEPAKQLDTAVVISVNGSLANALLSAYDAQWQWQIVEQYFKQQADVMKALQRVQSIKEQVQATRSAVFLPALSALSQVETQLQSWNSVPTSAYVAALEQAVNDTDSFVIKLSDRVDSETVAVTSSPAISLSLWQQVLTSLKSVIEIKRVDGVKNREALAVGTAAVLQQAIAARLSLSLSAARSGQWQKAQNHAKAAQKLAVDWSQYDGFVALNPLIEVIAFPSPPDFSVVNAALIQARFLLINEARSATSMTVPLVNKGGES